MKSKLNIIQETDRYVVINKEPGMLSIPDRFKNDLPNLYHILSKAYDKIYTVHRLDRGTSGVIIFAKDEIAHKHFSQLIEKRQAEKYYLALVNGIMDTDSGTIEKAIAETNQRGIYAISKRGKPSTSHYEVVEKYKNASLVKVKIDTGRTHQIRVHLASIGHPLFVDNKYGTRSEFYLSELKGRKYRTNRTGEERPLLTRHSLHAAELIIKDLAGKEIHLVAELPKDLRATIKQLEKYK